MVRPCESTRTLPRLVLAMPIVAACPSAAFGGVVAAVASLLLLLLPQAVTAIAARGTASAEARRVIGLRRLMCAPSRGCYRATASCLRSPLSSATRRLFGPLPERDAHHARTPCVRSSRPVAQRGSRAPTRTVS